MHTWASDGMQPEAGASIQRIELRTLDARYGDSHVLHGINLSVTRGEVVALLGRNGAGKTTILRSIIGTQVERRGEVLIDGLRVDSWRPYRIARLGIGYVPEERGIFSRLTVEENLMLPPQVKPGGMSLGEIHRLFPNLQERARTAGTALSGGEQQMLAIARILRTGADIILLDEPTEGLAPVIVDHIASALQELKGRGYTVLLVEQNLPFAAEIADRYYVIDEGRVVDMFDHTEIDGRFDHIIQYLSV